MSNDEYINNLSEKSSSNEENNYKELYEELKIKTKKSNVELEGRLNG